MLRAKHKSEAYRCENSVSRSDRKDSLPVLGNLFYVHRQPREKQDCRQPFVKRKHVAADRIRPLG